MILITPSVSSEMDLLPEIGDARVHHVNSQPPTPNYQINQFGNWELGVDTVALHWLGHDAD